MSPLGGGRARILSPLLVLLLFGWVDTQCPVTISDTCECKEQGRELQYIHCGHFSPLTEIPALGQYQSVIREVRVHNSCISAVQARAFQGLSIRYLFLRGICIESLDQDAFLGLDEFVELIYLDYNKLTRLPSGAFRTLSNLQYLKLDNNRINLIRGDYFTGMAGLISLDLSENRLTTIPVGAFERLTALSILKLSGNNIQTITEGVVSNKLFLSQLDLSLNEISKLSAKAFRALPRLESVSLSKNELKGFPDGLLEDVPELTTLDLSENNIQNLKTAMFANNNKLNILDISSNNLTGFPPSVFVGLGKLERLYLNNNQLKYMAPFAFEDLKGVQVLHLQGNEIKELPEGALEGMLTLKELNVCDNYIEKVGNAVFDRIDSLTSLDMSNNMLQELPFAPFGSQRRLVQVNLSQNKLTRISTDLFQKNVDLKELLLNDNKIGTIDVGSFNSLQALVDLQLHMNRITHLNASVFNLAQLKNLSLSHNPIRSITTESFYGLRNLEQLYLDNCCFTQLPGNAFKDMARLRELHLQNTPVEIIEENTFSGLRRLDLLNMSYANISSVVSGSFRYFSQIRTINLAYNRIPTGDLRHILFGPYVVEFLDVSHNLLTEVDQQEDGINRLGSIKEVHLAGNPFNCTCTTVWLRNFPPFVDFNHAWCASPKIDQGYLVTCSPIPFGCDMTPVTDDVYKVCAVNQKGDPDFVPAIRAPPEILYPVCYITEETTTVEPDDVTTDPSMVTSSIMSLQVVTKNRTVALSWYLLANVSDPIGFRVTMISYKNDGMLDESFYIDKEVQYNVTSFTIQGEYWKQYVACVTILYEAMNLTDYGNFVNSSNSSNQYYRYSVDTDEGLCITAIPNDDWFMDLNVEYTPFPTIPLAVGLGVFGLLLMLLLIWVIGRRYQSKSGRREDDEDELPPDLGKGFVPGQQDHTVDEITMSWDTLTSPQKNGKL